MRVGICTLGCRVNIYESEYVESLFKNHGYEIVDFNDRADIYVINTCSVTNESDKKSRKMVNQAKRRNSDAIVVVMGCYSQVKSDEVDADIVIGNKDKSLVISYVEEYLENKKRVKKIYNLREERFFEPMIIDNFDNHTRAFVKIQDGCNAFCSYCIIPYTRGSIRSKGLSYVVNEVGNLVKNGYKEIVLTGIHTGKYGIDLDGVNLEILLRELVKIKGLYRLRLSSIEINEITDGIMDLIKNNKIIASHFHVPLQSGSDKILKLMNRKYDLDYFKKRIKEIKDLRSDISITTDLIVGFPGEDDSDFICTINTLKEIGFTKIHTFPYSPRVGTPASSMMGQVDGNIKKKRVREVLNLSDELEYNYYKKYVDCVLEGVTEVRSDNSVIVHTSNFIPVKVDNINSNNEIVKVKIMDVINNNEVIGKVV